MKRNLAAGVFALGIAAAATSDAAVLMIEAAEIGSDTVFSFSGSFDVTGLSASNALGTSFAGVDPSSGAILFGGNEANLDGYVIPTPAFGTGGGVSGTGVGDTLKIFSDDVIGFAPGYAGGQISGSLTLTDESFTSLGLSFGTFTTSAANGATVELRIADPAAVIPLPATLPLLLGGLLGLGLLARRRRG